MAEKSQRRLKGVVKGALPPLGALGLYHLIRHANQAHQQRLREIYGRQPAPGQPPGWPFNDDRQP